MKRITMLIITILLMMTVFVPLATDNACAASSAHYPLKKKATYVSKFWEIRSKNHPHAGIDLSYGGIENDPVYAVMGGKVVLAKNQYGNYVGKYGKGYGKTVIIRSTANKKNYYFLYAHLNGYNVKVGDVVEKGEKIGRVGSCLLYTSRCV